MAGIGNAPQLIGEVFDLRFEGTSYVFERRPDGTVETLASSRAWKLEPASEEIVLARVEAGPPP